MALRTTLQKHTDIRKEYQKDYLDKTYKGVQIYTDKYAFLKLAEKYYMSPSTIEHIVYHRGNYKTKK